MDKSTLTFEQVVFPAEMEEIEKRRRNSGLNLSEQKLSLEPTINNNLVGLSCSGGGIRSASFCLGVLQHLISTDNFKKVDYLSTVSGGGYIGSCISALTHANKENEKLLIDRDGGEEPPALNQIRNFSQYLNAGGVLSTFRIPVLFLEGTLRSLLMFFPLVIFAVFMTEVFFEITGRFSDVFQKAIPMLGVLPLIVSLLLRPIFKDRHNWKGRDAADARLNLYAVFAVSSVLAIPVLAVLRSMVSLDANGLFEQITLWLQSHYSVALAVGIVCVAVFIWGLLKARDKLAIVLASISAPGVLIGLYVVLCVEAINSPYSYHTVQHHSSLENPIGFLMSSISSERSLIEKPLDCSQKFTLPEKGDITAASITINGDNSYKDICLALDVFLIQKNIKLTDYAVETIGRGELVLARKQVGASTWQNIFTTGNRPVYTVTVVSEHGDNNRLLQIKQLMLLQGNAEWWLYIMGFIVLLYNAVFVNVNRFSLHPFYRDRLSRTFLFNKKVGEPLAPIDDIKMSELSQGESCAPYHIINTALNLQGSTNPQLRSRKTVPFCLAKRYCGSDYTGFCKTPLLEAEDRYFNLGSAMAISAAAASPNMGTVTVKPLSFLLTLLNIRLNYWLPHPARVQQQNHARRFSFGSLGLRYLLREALGLANEKTDFVNCSDGGHIENLGAYELLKRGCKTIICIDAEADPDFTFNGLVTLQRYAEIDLGIRIDLNLDNIKPKAGLSQHQYAEGTIHYNNGETGRLLYLKLSFSGSEPEYLHYYRSQNPAFPHQSTSDQFFDETQFEVYRALGGHVAKAAAEDIQTLLSS